MIRPKPPSEPQSNPYLPDGVQPLAFETFNGLNTQATRPAINDDQMAWCDGFMPIGPGNLRTLYGVGPYLFLPTTGTPVWFDFANIGPIPYMFVALTDGSVWVVDTQGTMPPGQMLPPGSILAPAVGQMGLTQWGATYAILVANQANGYFVFDGAIVYQAGSLAPIVTITDGGSGYTSPAVTASGGAGSGALFTAIEVGGIITEINIIAPGSGYNPGDVVTLAITDGGPGTGATATVTLMPFGVRGQGAEVYQARVWIFQDATATFSAPESVSDFATSDGGGTFTSTDSFLRVRWSRFRQTNGFLYLIADSSINYISQVTTSGTPPTTTFSNQNANPEVGSPWGSTVEVFSENIVFANAFGAHVSYGGKVTKTSDALNGLWNTVPIFGGMTPSSARAIIFGKRVWMVLLNVVDQISGEPVNKLMMWDGKLWWTSQQNIPLVYIATQEVDSVLTAWGTDGNAIYQLFLEPTAQFTKTVQSKLWAKPGLMFVKTSERQWGMVYNFFGSAVSMNFSTDNETSSAGPSVISIPSGTGVYVFPPQACAQTGVLAGMTLSTAAPDLALVAAAIDVSVFDYRG